MTAEHSRLTTDGASWKQWGPYLAERAWGTVREDYSADGDAWAYFPYDQARSRAYRWSEDGLGAICDDQQRLCFALALWNGQDSMLKERLFGLTGPQGNHGEDVKEYYFYLDSTPTHSYMKMLYKYPQRAFPYADLVETSQRRGRSAPEYELLDTGIFAEDRYFDVVVEYAKAAPDDLLIRISATNHGPAPAELHLLPTLWFRNTWSWGDTHDDKHMRPELRRAASADNSYGPAIDAEHATLGRYTLHCNPLVGWQRGDIRLVMPTSLGDSLIALETLFCENETNTHKLFGSPNASPFVKDGIDDAVVYGRADAVNPAGRGTKAAAHYQLFVEAGATVTVQLRLTANQAGAPFADFDQIMSQRIADADAFYAALQPQSLDADARAVQRQAFAGLLWSKQFFAYEVEEWLRGDPDQPLPPPERRSGRNHEWRHLNVADIISMPDTWEYPWFAAWDLAFHCIPLALVDPTFAKEQLILFGREWMQHPNGQVPAYEWAFSDVNPPVLAWAVWRVYKIDEKYRGQKDILFLERAFHKLLLNFTWWVNRKDAEGNNVFQGGFLGLDNIGVFNRSSPLPTGGRIEQSDGTAWMGMFCLNMLAISLELASQSRAYEDIATKFFQHFLAIAAALNNLRGEGVGLWDEQDQFFYDVLRLPSGATIPMRLRSMVGLIPLFAVTTIEPAQIEQLPAFAAQMAWFFEHRPELASLVSRWQEPGMGERRLLALVRGHRMKRVLARMLDESEFFSPHGVRSVSRAYRDTPYLLDVGGGRYTMRYLPAESDSGLFGGNSNWRGPVWFPVNYLLVEALQQFHHYYGDDFLVECPTGSGQYLTLAQIADELSRRLVRLFLRDGERRPVYGEQATFQHDARWRDYILFHEYFHGDDGAGLGASHQTGWTGLVAKLLQQQGERADRGKAAGNMLPLAQEIVP